jgi:hypothetical protein
MAWQVRPWSFSSAHLSWTYFLLPGGIDIEVVAPAGEFDAVVAHLLDERSEFFEAKGRPIGR